MCHSFTLLGPSPPSQTMRKPTTSRPKLQLLPGLIPVLRSKLPFSKPSWLLLRVRGEILGESISPPPSKNKSVWRDEIVLLLSEQKLWSTFIYSVYRPFLFETVDTNLISIKQIQILTWALWHRTATRTRECFVFNPGVNKMFTCIPQDNMSLQ